MVDSSKISGAAAQAGEIAGKVKDKVSELAGEVVHRAGPVASQVGERAGEIAQKAGTATAHGVEAAAGSLKSATGGKGADKIDKVSSAVRKVLDRGGAAESVTEQGE